MKEDLEIRASERADLPAIEALYRNAFPNEDLLPLVRDLLREPSVSSHVGNFRAKLVAHVAFTGCAVEGTSCNVALLGPLAVDPKRQKQGIGSAMVRYGLKNLAGDGTVRVCVLGDPTYYGRLGFKPEQQIEPPYAIPTQWRTAWQSISLGKPQPTCTGRLAVPQPWRQPALWGP